MNCCPRGPGHDGNDSHGRDDGAACPQLIDPSGAEPHADRNGLNQVFRGRYLDADVRRFQRRPPSPRQAFMLDQLQGVGRIVDLGSGVGALSLRALERGASEAVLVDASVPALEAARDLAAQRTLSERVSLIQGDAAWLEEIPGGRGVVLDRVVCCYPDASRLLGKAANLSEELLIFSYPAPTWWMGIGFRLLNASLSLFRRAYRVYLHPEESLLAAAAADGHELQQVSRFGTWRVAVLRRSG